MFTINDPRPHFGRRPFLRAGAAGALGLSGLLCAAETKRTSTARRCILLFLTGGPPQHDTWDPKPDAPAEIRGELRPIATNVAGLRVSELFPRLAQRADRLCIVRSVTHRDRVHTTAGYTMLTGVPHPKANEPDVANVRPLPHDHPHVGALLAKARPGADGTPSFVSLPEIVKDANVNEFPGLNAGFLGAKYAPFRIDANAERTALRLPDVFLADADGAEQLNDRERLLGRLDRGLRADDSVRDMDIWYRKAFGVIRSDAVRKALDLNREGAKTRERYGAHLFGQGCLMARRLVEAGVDLVTVYWHYEGPDDSPVWDTHWNNFKHLRERLMPPTDRAFSVLLDDLEARGMLADTLVVCMGEFGRSPKINKEAGRDHWSAAQSIVLAGAGIRAGSVYGATDRIGAEPADKPVTPADVTATILHVLGVPEDLEIADPTGRPIRACSGKPIAGVLA